MKFNIKDYDITQEEYQAYLDTLCQAVEVVEEEGLCILYIDGIHIMAFQNNPSDERIDFYKEQYIDRRLIEHFEYAKISQLDRIEAMVSKNQQDIIDEYTLELIESGVIS